MNDLRSIQIIGATVAVLLWLSTSAYPQCLEEFNKPHSKFDASFSPWEPPEEGTVEDAERGFAKYMIGKAVFYEMLAKCFRKPAGDNCVSWVEASSSGVGRLVGFG